MQPQKLKDELIKAFRERDEEFQGNPTCDPFVLIADLQRQLQLAFWAIGKLCSMIEERDNPPLH